MALTPVLGFPYLAGTDAPNLPANNNSLAAGIEDVLGTRIQHGTITVTGSGITYASAILTFPIAFSAAPKVFVSLTDSLAVEYMASVTSITATNCSIVIATRTEVSFSESRKVAWIAMGLS